MGESHRDFVLPSTSDHSSRGYLMSAFLSSVVASVLSDQIFSDPVAYVGGSLEILVSLGT